MKISRQRLSCMPPGHLERATYLPLLFLILKNVICGSLSSLSLGAVSSDLDREDFGAPARQSEFLSWVRSRWNEWGWWCGVMCEEQVVEGGGRVVAGAREGTLVLGCWVAFSWRAVLV